MENTPLIPFLLPRGVVSPSPMGELGSIAPSWASFLAIAGEEDGNINGEEDGTASSALILLDARGVACDPAACD
jgi:hypothetical protein